MTAISALLIRDIKLAALHRNIGVVFQETLMFNRSIADNLRVGKPNAREAEMRAALSGVREEVVETDAVVAWR